MENKKYPIFFYWLYVLSLCGIAGYFFGSLGLLNHFNLKGALFFLIVFILAFLLQIVIHESGHFFFGKLTGYQFVSFRIFSWTLIKTETGYQFKKQSIPGTLGQCLMLPPTYLAGEFPFKIYLSGGVLMNVFTSIALLLVGVLTKQIDFFIWSMSFFGFLFAGINSIPIGFNDGVGLKKAWSNQEVQFLLYKQLRVNAEMLKGTRMQDLPGEFFEYSQGNQFETFYHVWVFFANYSLELEKMNFQKAESLLDVILVNKEQLVIPYQIELLKEKLFCLCLSNPESLEVQTIFENPLFKQGINSSQMSNKRILATYEFFIRKNQKTAAELCHVGLNLKSKNPYLTDIRIEENLIRWLQLKFY